MTTTRARFVCVALLVCLFAVGMATFLNYFKYKATAGEIVKSRILVVANAIEGSVQASLALGLTFGELGMLPSLLEREKASDELILGIDIFDPQGKQLYSTQTEHVGQTAPPAWLKAATEAKADWYVEEPSQFVTGIAIKNNFNLTVGYMGVRYSRAYVDGAMSRVGKRLLGTALPVLGVLALIAPLALILVVRRFEHDMQAMAATFNGATAPPGAQQATLDESLAGLKTSLEEAELGLLKARVRLAKQG
jgi:hypothetical protein